MHVNAAHLADLVRDDISGGRDSLAKANAVLSDDIFELPQVMLWVSQIRQLLYEGQYTEARCQLMERWPCLQASRLMTMSYHEWLMRTARCLRPDHGSKCSGSIKGMPEGCSTADLLLLKLRGPTFFIYTQALQLALEAAEGKVPSRPQWQGAARCSQSPRAQTASVGRRVALGALASNGFRQGQYASNWPTKDAKTPNGSSTWSCHFHLTTVTKRDCAESSPFRCHAEIRTYSPQTTTNSVRASTVGPGVPRHCGAALISRA